MSDERKFCQVCASRWMRQLWENSCVCSGHVNLTFTMPGVLPEAKHKIEKKVVVEQPKKPKLYTPPAIAFKRKRR